MNAPLPTDRRADVRGLERLRADFPLLGIAARDGKPLVYLDSAATSQKPRAVIAAVAAYYETMNANVHRGIHWLAEQATGMYEGTRAKLAAFVGAPDARGVVFTRGATEAINLVAHGWGRKFLRAGDEIVVTGMEHHSNLVPWQMLARDTGAVLRHVPVTEALTLDLDAFRRLLGPRTRLLAVTQMSNLLGTVNPVREMAAEARRAGAVTLVDGAQSVPQRPVDFRDLGCDFLVFSGHKMLAPTGIGALVAKPELLEAMDPFLGGGDMISKVYADHATWAEIPHKFEAGTPHMDGAAGWAAALDYLSAAGMDAVRAHEEELCAHAEQRLAAVPGLRPFWPRAERGGAMSFALEGVHPHDIAHFLDREGIAVRAGHMCVQPLLRQFGLPALTRASFHLYNTRDEIDRLAEALVRVKGFFDRGT